VQEIVRQTNGVSRKKIPQASASRHASAKGSEKMLKSKEALSGMGIPTRKRANQKKKKKKKKNKKKKKKKQKKQQKKKKKKKKKNPRREHGMVVDKDGGL